MDPAAGPVRVAILGCGFMGSALLKGFLKRQSDTSQVAVQLAACVTSSQSLDKLRNSLGEKATQVTLGHGNEFAIKIAEEAQVIILGVRPGDLDALLETPNIAQALSNRIVVSMLAGVSHGLLETKFNAIGLRTNGNVMIVMPTIGAQNGDSVSLLAPNSTATLEAVTLVRELFTFVGSVTDVPENLINHGVAVGATCHALSLVAVDAITDAGVAEGIPRPLAATLARRALQSALSVLESGMSVEQLKEALSTPKGITLNSVVQYERGGVRGGIAENTQQAIKYACSM